MSEPIVVATSLVPNVRVDLQRRAVDSWLELGFSVVSYNGPAEIEQLAGTFGDIALTPMIRTGTLWSGKPVVFISDMMHALRAFPGLCGIVNSDIVFAKDTRFVDSVREGAASGFLYGPRLDIDAIDDPAGQLDLFGADFFFFNSRLADTIPESHLCLGMPHWDHWLPLMALLAGHKTTKLVCPFARHVRHPVSRDDSFFMFADEFVQQVVASMRETHRPSGTKAPFFIPNAQARYARLKAAAMLGQQTGDEHAAAAIEELAGFIDEVSRYVVVYLERNVQRVAIG